MYRDKNPLDDYFDLLVEYGIATEEEIKLVITINGYTGETLNDILFARTGYRNWEQFAEAELEEYNDEYEDEE